MAKEAAEELSLERKTKTPEDSKDSPVDDSLKREELEARSRLFRRLRRRESL